MRRLSLWTDVDRSGTCWLWTGRAGHNGYGRLTNPRTGQTEYAHRLMYEGVNGQIPDGLLVCHVCDVRLCVRPDHLFLGTDADNQEDKRLKGRAQQLTLRKVSSEQAAEILQRRRAGESGAQLAKEYNISQQLVCDIFKQRRRRGIS